MRERETRDREGKGAVQVLPGNIKTFNFARKLFLLKSPFVYASHM